MIACSPASLPCVLQPRSSKCLACACSKHLVRLPPLPLLSSSQIPPVRLRIRSAGERTANRAPYPCSIRHPCSVWYPSIDTITA